MITLINGKMAWPHHLFWPGQRSATPPLKLSWHGIDISNIHGPGIGARPHLLAACRMYKIAGREASSHALLNGRGIGMVAFWRNQRRPGENTNSCPLIIA